MSSDRAEEELRELIGECYYDPLRYTEIVFPWGAKNTVLENSKGPRSWQHGFLVEWGQEIGLRDFDGITPVDPIELSTVSGHGIGKSALTAFIIKFIHDTRPYSKGIVTANTSDQLKTKTWAELGKWHKLSLTRHWSEYFASRGNMALVNVENPESWRVDAQTCREENSESFAGNHSASSTAFYVFDEASAVPDPIWEVSDGGLTDGEPMRFSFGNGTKSSGRFRDCHGKLKHRVITRNIDSREVEGTNKELFEKWAEDFGEDSDFFRVRVKGMFPNKATTQFIESDSVFSAQKRKVIVTNEPLVLGVDVARFGDDKSVIVARRGRDAKTFKKREYRGISTTSLTTNVIGYITELKRQGYLVSAVFVDGNGVGGGVVDQLRDQGVSCVIDVQFGEKAHDEKKYANKRAECYGLLRDWIKGAAIPRRDVDLEDSLVSIEYGFDRHNRILLESKDSMKSRGLPSPDDSDAYAITFAVPIVTDHKYPGINRRSGKSREKVHYEEEY